MKRRKPIKRKSDRQKIAERNDTLIREIMKLKRGRRCELCGRHEDNLPFPLSTFHILRKQVYPNMRYHEGNLLLACFTPMMNNKRYCHDAWHMCNSDEPEYVAVEKAIIAKRGENYSQDLKLASQMMPRNSAGHLLMLNELFKLEKNALLKGQSDATL